MHSTGTPILCRPRLQCASGNLPLLVFKMLGQHMLDGGKNEDGEIEEEGNFGGESRRREDENKTDEHGLEKRSCIFSLVHSVYQNITKKMQRAVNEVP